jgi:hypothetical protein
MSEFMALQCLALALIIIFPAIATSFPERMRRESASVKVEQVDDSQNRLERSLEEQSQDDEGG